jgi:hypothetical protein
VLYHHLYPVPGSFVVHVVIRVRLLVITPIPIVVRRLHRRLMRRRRDARHVMCCVTLIDGLTKTEIPEHIVPIPQVI